MTEVGYRTSSLRLLEPSEHNAHQNHTRLDHAFALYRCGMARLHLCDVRGAFEDFQEAARLEPGNREIWKKYDETYQQMQSEVEDEFAQGLDNDFVSQST